jgi:hypothetical protein
MFKTRGEVCCDDNACRDDDCRERLGDAVGFTLVEKGELDVQRVDLLDN